MKSKPLFLDNPAAHQYAQRTSSDYTPLPDWNERGDKFVGLLTVFLLGALTGAAVMLILLTGAPT
jgi:hypothetical protein